MGGRATEALQMASCPGNSPAPFPTGAQLTRWAHRCSRMRLRIGALGVRPLRVCGLWIRSIGPSLGVGRNWVGVRRIAGLAIRCRLELTLWVGGHWIRSLDVARGHRRLRAWIGVPRHQEALLVRHGDDAGSCRGRRGRQVKRQHLYSPSLPCLSPPKKKIPGGGSAPPQKQVS